MKFKNQDEARAWDLYAAAGLTKCASDIADLAHDADAMLEERRKRWVCEEQKCEHGYRVELGNCPHCEGLEP